MAVIITALGYVAGNRALGSRRPGQPPSSALIVSGLAVVFGAGAR